MSDLPTHEEAAEWVEHIWGRIPDPTNGAAQLIAQQYAIDCLTAYAEGRLIDRDALDYEAAEGLLRQYPIQQPWIAQLGGWGPTMKEVVDAALPKDTR